MNVVQTFSHHHQFWFTFLQKFEQHHFQSSQQDCQNLYTTFHGTLRGKGTPNQNLACFVHYLKIINTFLENNMCIMEQIVSKALKNGIKILVGQAVLELLIKTIFCMFWSIIQEPLDLLNI